MAKANTAPSADPIKESVELEKAQSEAGLYPSEFVQPQEGATHIILTRENIILIGPRLWNYTHDGSLSDCKIPTAFKGQMATNFGVRSGDKIICGSPSQGIDTVTVCVPYDKE